MDPKLKREIDNWEGSPLVASFNLAGTVQRIIKNDNGKYSMLRYFQIAASDNWYVSVDKQNVKAGEIIRVLTGLLGGPADHG